MERASTCGLRLRARARLRAQSPGWSSAGSSQWFSSQMFLSPSLQSKMFFKNKAGIDLCGHKLLSLWPFVPATIENLQPWRKFPPALSPSLLVHLASTDTPIHVSLSYELGKLSLCRAHVLETLKRKHEGSQLELQEAHGLWGAQCLVPQSLPDSWC